MKLFVMAVLASTALVPAALAQGAQQPGQQGAQTRPAQSGAQQVSATDFVKQAGVGNMFEIESSELAQQRSQNDQVRQFAQRMIQDHNAAGERLRTVARSIQGATVPTSLDQQHQQMMQTMQNAQGQGFDRAYVQMQVTAHRNSVNLFQQYAQDGDNQQLQQFAQQTLPTLREHLQSAQQLQNALPPAQVGQQQGQGQMQMAQGQQQTQDGTNVVVRQPAPVVQVDPADPRVIVNQQQPRVTVNQQQPEILVRQPQPTVTVNIPQPEIIVRMPQPDVNVAMAQPQVRVQQPEPDVRVQQPQQPRVQVEQVQPQVQFQQAQGQPQVQVQRAGEPVVRYERAEPRVVVNQAEGQPNVRFEQQGEPNVRVQQQGQQMAATSGQRPMDNPQATGALPGAQAIAVSRVTEMDLYNTRGNELGDIERVVQGQDGKQYIVIGAGGFLGIGERKVAIPADQVAMQGDRLVIQGVTEDQIRSMPAYDRNNGGFRDLDDNQQVQINAMR